MGVAKRVSAFSIFPRQVFNLYRIAGGKTYVGENINQVQHGAQAAMLAEIEEMACEVVPT